MGKLRLIAALNERFPMCQWHEDGRDNPPCWRCKRPLGYVGVVGRHVSGYFHLLPLHAGCA